MAPRERVLLPRMPLPVCLCLREREREVEREKERERSVWKGSLYMTETKRERGKLHRI